MLINCKNCNKKFLIDKSELDLEGSLITCKHCNKEWIFESRTHFLEKKLAELDNDLKQKEIHLTEQNDNHNIRIEALEKDLVNKNKELIKQKLLEERIATFEKRITDTEKLNSYQANLEIQRDKLEEAVKTTSENIILKNIDIEKKTNYLEMKINSYDFNNMDKVNNPIAINDVVNLNNYEHDEKRKKETKKNRYFWPKNTDK